MADVGTSEFSKGEVGVILRFCVSLMKWIDHKNKKPVDLNLTRADFVNLKSASEKLFKIANDMLAEHPEKEEKNNG